MTGADGADGRRRGLMSAGGADEDRRVQAGLTGAGGADGANKNAGIETQGLTLPGRKEES